MTEPAAIDCALPTLWGRGDSTNVQKVIFACAELGQPFAPVRVGGPFGGTDAAAFAAMNPNRTVPVWQDGPHALWESHAILRHLARGGGALGGKDAWAMAAVDQWLDWYASVLWHPARALFLGIFRDRTMDWDDPVMVSHAAALERALAILGGQLDVSAHVAGGAFTIADIACGIGVGRVRGMGGPVAVPPAVLAWHGRISARPAYGVATAEEPTNVAGTAA